MADSTASTVTAKSKNILSTFFVWDNEGNHLLRFGYVIDDLEIFFRDSDTICTYCNASFGWENWSGYDNGFTFF